MKSKYSFKVLIHFVLRAKMLSNNPRFDQGYAMLVVSMISMILLSLLAAAMVMTDLTKKSTSAYINSSSTFYAAESGLNRRAQELRSKFLRYSRPVGTSPTGKSCRDSSDIGSGDFACVNYNFKSSAPSGNVLVSGSGGSTTVTDRDDSKTYVSSTFVEGSSGDPSISIIPQGDLFQGMSMQEYVYRVSSWAKILNSINSNDTDQSALQMDFKARLVPLFQFAVFYNGDLEVFPGPSMSIEGKIHSNGGIFLGSGSSLTLNGNITSAGGIHSMYRAGTDAGVSYPASAYADNVVKIVTSSSGVVPIVTTSLLAANNNTATLNSLSQNQLNSVFGERIKSGVTPITVPQVGFLGKTDTDQPDGIGTYYGKADLRIEYQPNQPVPIAVTVIKTGSTGADSSTCTGLYVSNDRSQPSCRQLTPDQIRSLTQPVMVSAKNNNERALAPDGQEFVSSPTNLSIARAVLFQKRLVRSGTLKLDYADLDKPITSSSFPSISGLEFLFYKGLTPRKIANQAGRFYLPAPIQIYDDFINNRERVGTSGKNIKLVQTNLKSLSFWNRDNTVTDSNNVDKSEDQVLWNRTQSPLASGSKYASVCNGNSEDLRNRSLQCLGLSASDTSEGGMVIHATVSATATSTYASGSSPYGFAFVGGSNLPGSLTIASDQAVYVQGDYNYHNSSATEFQDMSTKTPANGGLKEPAAILADSLNVLSNNCLSLSDDRLNCGTATPQVATKTSLNVAFLAGTDAAQDGGAYSGGLENYPRLHENWAGESLFYRGSFVSLGSAQNVSGKTSDQTYFPPNRDWNYDASFNDAINLPPLTPRLIYLRQNVFSRK